MQNYTTRLERLERTIDPQRRPNYVQAIMDFDDHGICATLEMDGRTFTPLPGESEDEPCDRAKQEAGHSDCQVLLIQLVKAGPNGALAPGFERFAI